MRAKTKKFIKTQDKRRTFPFIRKRFCRFCKDKTKSIDYKDIRLLEAFIKERGKIISRRLSGNCAKHQRRITEAIKMARFISLLPYVRY